MPSRLIATSLLILVLAVGDSSMVAQAQDAGRAAAATGDVPGKQASSDISAVAATPKESGSASASLPDKTASGSGPLAGSTLFRRVLVPEKELANWPRGSNRYLPIDAAEFEQLIGKARQSGESEPAPLDAQVVQARYSAQLVNDELVDGEGSLDVQCSTKAPVMLSLDPCRMAIESPKWIPRAAKSAADRINSPSAQSFEAAIVGVGSDGKLALRIERSGTLRFAWSLRGQRETGGGLVFALRLPRCPSSQLELILPTDLVPTVEEAVVTPLTAGEDRLPRRNPSMQRWQIEMGGHNLGVLRINKRDSVAGHRPLTLARQALIYDFSPRGLQVSADLKLDILREPIHQVTLDLDWPLTLVTARYGDKQLSWTDEAADAGNDAVQQALDKVRTSFDGLGLAFPMQPRRRRLVLRLPEPLRGSGRVLRLGAVAPLPTSGRLPTVRPGDDEVVWQEGIATLLVPLPLELSDLRTSGCRQTKQEPLVAPAQGDAVTLQYFRADADVFVGIRRQPDHCLVHSATIVDVRGTTIGGRTAAELTATDGETFSLAADVPSSWIVDSIDTTPAGGITTWSVEAPRAGMQRLSIGLSKALRRDRPLRLVVVGRWRRAPLSETLKLSELAMVRFRAVENQRQLVGVKASSPYRLQWSGADELTRLNPDRLEPDDASLIGNPVGATLFVVDRHVAPVQVTINRESPRYDGRVDLRIDAGDDSLSETYSLTCTPQDSEIDHLLVHLSKPAGEALPWEIVGATGAAPQSPQSVAARRLNLSAATQAGLGVAGGEVWELSWSEPRSEPFTLRATRSTPMTAAVPIALAAFVQAESQTGTVEVHSSGRHLAEIVNRRLKPAMLPPATPGVWPAVVAAYEYAPLEEALSASADGLASLMIGPGKSLGDTWVWSLVVNAHLSSSGHNESRAVWRLENWGRKRVDIRLPAGATVRSASIDGTPVAIVTGVGSGSMPIELPMGRRFTTVELKWATEGDPLAMFASRTLESPEIVELPVLARRLNVWLPPNYRLNESHSDNSEAANRGDASSFPGISWRQRLFGLLGRPARESPFNPFSVDDWKRIAESLPTRKESSMGRQISGRLASAVSRAALSPPNDRLTWGELLSAIDTPSAPDSSEDLPPVLVDSQSLAGIGIDPTTPLYRTGRAPLNQTASPFEVTDIVVLESRVALLVTTRSAAASLGCSEISSPSTTLACAAPAELLNELRSAVDGKGARFIPVGAWKTAAVRGPWSTGSDNADVDHAGWNVYQLNPRDGKSVRIWLFRHDAIVGLGCGAFLLVALLVWLTGDLRRRWRLALTVSAAVVALLTPAIYAPIPTGAWMGLLCGWALRWVTQFHVSGRRSANLSSNSPAAADRSRLSATKTGGPALLLIACLAAASRELLAADANLPSGAVKPAIYDVLIPIDQDQHPTGREVLVPEPLYEQLTRRAGRRTAAEQNWLITSALYQGAIGGGVGPAPRDWTARFEIQTFDAAAVVQIPFGGEGLSLVPEGVRVDGSAVQFEWKNSGRSLALEIAEPGRHQLAISFRPTMQAANSVQSVDFGIPSLPTSRLQLDVPPDTQVDVPTARGHLSRESGGERLIGSLGPSDRLTMHWGESGAFEPNPVLSDADELLWLKVRPGSVVLESRFTLRVADGRLRQVQLNVDPRLRRLPLEGGSPVAQARAGAEGSGTIYLGLARPIADEVTFKLAFLLTETSAIGDLQLPRLDVVGARKVNRRMAVSIEPPLEADEKSFGRLKSMPVGDFLSSWGASDSKPLVAFQLSETDRPPSFAIHSREPNINCVDSTVASVEAQRLNISWMSDMNVHGGPVFQLHIAAPQSFTVDEVSLVDSTESVRPLRWSRGLLGGVTVFLPGPPGESYKVLVRGGLPISPGAPIELPELKGNGCKLESQTVIVLRAPDLLATVADRGGLTEHSSQNLPALLERAIGDGLVDRKTVAGLRFVAGLAGSSPRRPILIHAALNSPRIEGTEMTTMRHDNDSWSVAVDLDLKVSGGTLDSLRFELPPQWDAPFQVEPAMSSELLEVPSESRKQFVLHPAEPLTGGQHVRLSATLANTAGQRLRVPDIRLMGTGLRRFVRLPTKVAGQRLIWEQRGLSVEPLPRGFSAEQSATELYQIYRIIGETFEAALKSVEKGAEGPRVKLADVRLAFQNRAHGFGTAAFEIEPGGATSCLLDVPREYRLVHVQVNDGPTIVSESSPHRWTVSLAGGKLPQRLEIVFVIGRAAGGRELEEAAILAPSLIGFPVEQSLWSIEGLDAEPAAAGAAPLYAVTPLDGRLVQLKSAAGDTEAAASLLSGDSEERISQYYTFAARRYVEARGAALRQAQRSSDAPAIAQADAAIRSSDSAQALLAKRLGTQKILNDLSANQPSADSPGDLWQFAANEFSTPVMFSSSGFGGSLAMTPAAGHAGEFFARLFTIAMVATVIAGLFWLGGREDILDTVARRPEILGAVVGFAWWFWLSPSFAGFAVFFLSIGLAVRRSRRRRQLAIPSGREQATPASSVRTSISDGRTGRVD